MFPEAFSVQIDIPETLHIFGKSRVDSEIISEHTVRMVSNLSKETACFFNLISQLVERHILQTVLNERRDRLRGTLHACKIGFQIHCPGFAHQGKHLVGIVVSEFLDRFHTDKCGNAQRNNDRAYG